MRVLGMTTSTPPGDDGDDPGERRLFSRDVDPPPSKWRPRVILLGVVTLMLVGVWLWLHSSEDRALLAMAPAQRKALFHETQQGFRLMCLSDAGKDFIPRCRQQATFLARFPECDTACRQEISPYYPGPLR
ncbi:hypothetical protein JGU66_07495 [Myxococcaceae bacterium JPH2]|nr:hypothetical protein [Myxococcaceae bacterium JPH2]